MIRLHILLFYNKKYQNNLSHLMHISLDTTIKEFYHVKFKLTGVQVLATCMYVR